MMAMITVRPTAEQIFRAEARVADMRAKIIARYGKTHLDNSIREGEGELVGLLGEELIYDRYVYDQQRRLFTRATGNDIYDFDLTAPLTGTVDVKTKSCTSVPQPHYWCTVCAANTHQRCDYYCFVRVLEDLSQAWILGFVPKPFFFNNAVFFRKGDIDPMSHCNWQFRWDCYNMPVSQLWAPPWDADSFTLQGAERWQPRRLAHIVA